MEKLIGTKIPGEVLATVEELVAAAIEQTKQKASPLQYFKDLAFLSANSSNGKFYFSSYLI